MEEVRRRRQPWYWIDNRFMEQAAELGIAAIAVYNLLAYRANQEQRTWPSLNSMANDLGISKRTVIRALQKLEAAGWLIIERRQEPGRGNISNVYTLTTPYESSQETSSEPSHPSDSDALPVTQSTEANPSDIGVTTLVTQMHKASDTREPEQDDIEQDDIEQDDIEQKIHTIDPDHINIKQETCQDRRLTEAQEEKISPKAEDGSDRESVPGETSTPPSPNEKASHEPWEPEIKGEEDTDAQKIFLHHRRLRQAAAKRLGVTAADRLVMSSAELDLLDKWLRKWEVDADAIMEAMSAVADRLKEPPSRLQVYDQAIGKIHAERREREERDRRLCEEIKQRVLEERDRARRPWLYDPNFRFKDGDDPNFTLW